MWPHIAARVSATFRGVKQETPLLPPLCHIDGRGPAAIWPPDCGNVATKTKGAVHAPHPKAPAVPQESEDRLEAPVLQRRALGQTQTQAAAELPHKRLSTGNGFGNMKPVP